MTINESGPPSCGFVPFDPLPVRARTVIPQCLLDVEHAAFAGSQIGTGIDREPLCHAQG